MAPSALENIPSALKIIFLAFEKLKKKETCTTNMIVVVIYENI